MVKISQSLSKQSLNDSRDNMPLSECGQKTNRSFTLLK